MRRTMMALASCAALMTTACERESKPDETPDEQPSAVQPGETPAADEASAKADEGSATPTGDPSTGDAKAAAKQQQLFASALLGDALARSGGKENSFLSPYSIHAALGMTWAGAKGQTASQMASALSIDLESAAQHDAMLAQSANVFAKNDDLTLNVANRIWPKAGMKLDEGYLGAIEEHYGAKPEALDYAGAPDAARATINGWVSEQTKTKIPELIPAGMIDGSTRMVLTNAIYFKGSWVEAFDPDATYPGTFTAPSGEVTAQLMKLDTQRLAYSDSEAYEVVSLPYAGGADMLVILPKKGQFEATAKALEGKGLSDVMNAPLGKDRVSVTLPKFEFRANVKLNDVLIALGMKDAFTSAADFTGMGEAAKGISISAVIHEAFIAVDEKGAEAAAATAVVMTKSAAPGAPVEFKVDRPFFFVIRDTDTNTPLFVGHVADPTAK